MVFSSLIFIYAFLVICYGIYAIVRKTGRTGNTVLLVSSLIFYAWGGPSYLLLLCGMTLICYFGARIIEGYDTHGERLCAAWVTVIGALSILVIFKYTGFFAENFKSVFGVPESVPDIALPLGISFYTFQLISYVIDVYREEVPAQKNYFTLLLYASLFHQCIAGPIVRYADVARELEHRHADASDISGGITRFAVGLAKKALLANQCSALADKLLPLDAEKIPGISAQAIIIGSVFYMLYIYLDFSAYSDMAIGMGRMVGFHYKENFNYPYTATSVTDFWRRWHMSLSYFFRDYVYIPLGGSRCKLPRQILNLAVVWVLTGFWHGASWNFVLWGVYYLVLLMLEKFVFRIGREKPHGFTAVWRTALVLVFVWFGWILFRFEDLSMFGQAVAGMFTNWQADAQLGSILLNNWVFIIVAIIACTPIVPTVSKLIDKCGKGVSSVAGCVYAVIPAVLLVLSTLSLVGDSYSPFLYFNF